MHYKPTDFQIAFLQYFGEFSFHYPSNKLWNFFKNTEFIISHIISLFIAMSHRARKTRMCSNMGNINGGSVVLNNRL